MVGHQFLFSIFAFDFQLSCSLDSSPDCFQDITYLVLDVCHES